MLWCLHDTQYQSQLAQQDLARKLRRKGTAALKDYSSFGLKDKVAVVTGASQGIGRAIAIGLAQAGAHVVLAKYPGPRMEEIQRVQKEIEGLGRKSLVVVTDVNKVADCQALIDQTVAAFGRIDILVNNASWTGTGDALDVTEEEYDKTFDATVKRSE